MKKTLSLMVAACVVALMPSCMQMQPIAKETVPAAKVVLAKKNYRVLATQVKGEDSGFALLTGIQALTRFAAIIPFIDASKLPTGITLDAVSDAKALDNLYKNAGASNTGRATQLINVRKEYGGFNALIFGRPKIRYTADLIEFYTPGAVNRTAQPAASATPAPSPAPKKAVYRKKRR